MVFFLQLRSVQLCGFWTLPPSLLPTDPDPTLARLVDCLSDAPLLYVGFGSMVTYMLDVNWEAVFTVLDSGTLITHIWLLNFIGCEHNNYNWGIEWCPCSIKRYDVDRCLLTGGY